MSKLNQGQISLDLGIPAPTTIVNQAGTIRRVQTSLGVFSYHLKRGNRKSIALTIGEQGLQVSAPRWVSLFQIESVIAEKAQWIADKFYEWHQRQKQLQLQTIEWRNGVRLPYLGQEITLNLNPALRHPFYEGNYDVPSSQDVLHLNLQTDAGIQRIKDATQIWLQGRAQVWFEKRLEVFYQKTGWRAKCWRLSSAKGRWGSCSSDGTIRLNWRLIYFSPPIIDYVIAHELAHLKEMNHSSAFWEQVSLLMPDFEQAKIAIKEKDIRSLPL